MTQHHDEGRRQLYFNRHESRESQYYDARNPDNWYTKAFWAKWILWNLPSIHDSIAETEKAMGIHIKYTKSAIDKQ